MFMCVPKFTYSPSLWILVTYSADFFRSFIYVFLQRILQRGDEERWDGMTEMVIRKADFYTTWLVYYDRF